MGSAAALMSLSLISPLQNWEGNGCFSQVAERLSEMLWDLCHTAPGRGFLGAASRGSWSVTVLFLLTVAKV